MVTISEGRSILQTEDSRNPTRFFPNRQHHGIVRGNRLQRPSFTTYGTRVQSAMLNSPWRRLVARRNGQAVELQSRHSNDKINPLGAENNKMSDRAGRIRYFNTPSQIQRLNRLNHGQQVALRKSNMASSISNSHTGKKAAQPTSSRRGLRVNFNINDKIRGGRKTISVKGKNIKNIRFSHPSNNAIIDVHKYDRGTQVSISRRLRRPLVTNKGNMAVKELTKNMPQNSNDLSVRKTVSGTGNDKSATFVTVHKELTTWSTAGATLLSSLPVEITTAITPLLSKNEANITDSLQMNGSDINSQNAKTLTNTSTASEQKPLTGSVTKTLDNLSTSNTTPVSLYDLSTEEPDVTETPDVDNHVMSGTNFWYPFYTMLDQD
ncbi:hypothetical protein ACF0H5_024080 [Mactra antiquata]